MRYATIRAGRNKNRLKMKNNNQLWPFRRATRAGQNASATKMMKPTTPIAAQPAEDVASTYDSFPDQPGEREDLLTVRTEIGGFITRSG
jgi:hypothetical protein